MPYIAAAESDGPAWLSAVGSSSQRMPRVARKHCGSSPPFGRRSKNASGTHTVQRRALSSSLSRTLNLRDSCSHERVPSAVFFLSLSLFGMFLFFFCGQFPVNSCHAAATHERSIHRVQHLLCRNQSACARQRNFLDMP